MPEIIAATGIVHPIDQIIAQVRATLTQHGIPFCLIFPRPATTADRVDIAMTANMPPETIQGMLRSLFKPSEATKVQLTSLLNNVVLEALQAVGKTPMDIQPPMNATLGEIHRLAVEELLPALLQTLELQGIPQQKQKSNIILPG